MPAGNPAGYLPNVKKRLKRAGMKPYTLRSKRKGQKFRNTTPNAGPRKGVARPGLQPSSGRSGHIRAIQRATALDKAARNLSASHQMARAKLYDQRARDLQRRYKARKR